MKLILFIILLITAVFAGGSFCSGFKQGFRDGYCYKKYACIAPVAPICPIPSIGESGYMAGYNRGFLVGLSRQ